MKFSIPNARKLRGTLRFLVMVVACPIGSINCLAGSFILEPWLQGGAPPVEHAAVQDLPFAPPVSEQSLAEAETGSLGYGARAIGAMIVVLALIWITMILLKRYMPHRFGALGHQRRMQVLETLPIGEKRTLTLIRIDNEQLLLAGTPGSLALLKEIRVDLGQTIPPRHPLMSHPSSSEEGSFHSAPSRGNPSVETSRNFADVLADEVRNPLEQLSSLRRDLEAR